MDKLKPRAVIGTNSWGSVAYEKMLRGDAVDGETLKRAMRIAVNRGLYVVDSARDYGFGKGPKMIGEVCPKEMIISSKFTPLSKYKPGQVRESVEKDLQDFGRDHIEIYWLHMPNDIKENLTEMIALYRQGKVENIGISNFNLEECKQAKTILDAEGIPLYAVQNHYSLIDRTWEKNGLVDWCKENNVQFWAWAVLEEGILAGPKKSNEKFSIMKAIYSRKRRKLQKLFDVMKTIGEGHGISVAQVAIAFVVNKGIVPLCGCRKPYQVEDLKFASETIFSEQEMARLQEVSNAMNMTILGSDTFRFAVRKKG